MNILVKSGVEQLPLFEKEDFPYFEAYLRGDEDKNDLNQLLRTKMKLISIHLPHSIQTSLGKRPIDFCDSGETGKASFLILEKILNFSQKNDVKYIVIHLGFYNYLTEDRYSVLMRTAQRFKALPSGKVTLCLENVPCWTNLCFENEPVISDAEHFSYFKKYCPNIGLTFDTDHLAITAVFKHFYDGFKAGYLASEDRKAFREKMEKEIMQATRKAPDFFRKAVEQKIIAFLSQVQPDMVHAVGSDFCQYQEGKKLPLAGEALPLGYKGMIKGFLVEDRLDHAVWLSRIPKETWITIELMLRPEYNYIDQIQKSRKWIAAIAR
ncbi:TPA: hypothetical protein HA242_00420 [Candidatus Woesearchaeota archaeon]|nr:hypothetical protein [Candidatus Woesearchaeota archaeon]HIH12168.1 hypothetical protein [Candidatus Woesearchaeota archaeon]